MMKRSERQIRLELIEKEKIRIDWDSIRKAKCEKIEIDYTQMNAMSLVNLAESYMETMIRKVLLYGKNYGFTEPEDHWGIKTVKFYPYESEKGTLTLAEDIRKYFSIELIPNNVLRNIEFKGKWFEYANYNKYDGHETILKLFPTNHMKIWYLYEELGDCCQTFGYSENILVYNPLFH